MCRTQICAEGENQHPSKSADLAIVVAEDRTPPHGMMSPDLEDAAQGSRILTFRRIRRTEREGLGRKVHIEIFGVEIGRWQLHWSKSTSIKDFKNLKF